VEIGDGCATVTGYKLPKPLFASASGKAGARFEAPSQDTGLAVLVVVIDLMTNFSVTEKDEASLARECAPGFAECLHSPFCRGLKVFVFRPRAGLAIVNPLPRIISSEAI